MKRLTRRHLLKAVGAGAVMVAAVKAAAARFAATPRQTEGPFYPDVMPSDTDNDLVKIASAAKDAGGEILHLSGRVVDAAEKPIANALVEIWQCDMHGNYTHTQGASNAKRDNAFQGYGRTRADADGRYSFRTIKPVSYPGRTPHIHVKAHHPNGKVLTTQIYIEGEAGNARDFLYRSLSKSERQSVTVALQRTEVGDLRGEIDVVLPWSAS